MSDSAPNPLAALCVLAEEYLGFSVQAQEWRAIASGASGRFIARWSGGGGRSLIGIYWTPDRPDNAAYPLAATRLKQHGVRVPEILLRRDCGCGCGACLVEDLGDMCLLSLKGGPWAGLRKAYDDALREMARVHAVPAVGEELQPPFDAALYRWEQECFAGHFLDRHLHRDGSGLADKPAMRRMADFLAGQPRVRLHRDFQSQNVMIRNDAAWLIDFQGMRAGLAEYDLASLVFDPYMDLSLAQRMELLDDWEQISGHPLRYEVFVPCALQRIMQALGAFANLWYRSGREWYYPWLETGRRSLEQIARLPGRSAVAEDALACLHDEHVLDF